MFGLKEAIAQAVLGPSCDVRKHSFTLMLAGGHHLHDDEITEKEMALICGVYKEYTGMHSLHYLFCVC